MNAEEELREEAIQALRQIEAANEIENDKRRFGGLKMPEHIHGDTKLWIAIRKLEERVEALEKLFERKEQPSLRDRVRDAHNG